MTANKNNGVVHMIMQKPVWIKVIQELKKQKVTQPKTPMYITELYKKIQPVSLCQVQKIINELEAEKMIKSIKKERMRFIILTEKGEKSISF